MQYGQRGHSTNVLFKYRHSTDARDVQVDFSATILTLTTHSLSAFRQRIPRKKMWQTQDERKLLLFMQLFPQLLQVAATTLRLEELEEQERRGKVDRRRREARRRTGRQRTQWVRQWLLRRPMYGQYEKLMHELTTEDQTSFNNFLRVDPDIFMELLHRVGSRIEKQETFFGKALPLGLKLAVTLRYLATGELQKYVEPSSTSTLLMSWFVSPHLMAGMEYPSASRIDGTSHMSLELLMGNT